MAAAYQRPAGIRTGRYVADHRQTVRNSGPNDQVEGPVHIAGYIREGPPAGDGPPAFAQAERIRRYAADHAHDLVTICQDVTGPGRTDEAAGFRALLAVVGSGAVAAVVVASLDVLGDDAETQEVMAWELRRRGAEVVSTRQADQALLADDTPDGARRTARRVLERVDEVDRRLTG